MPVSVLLILGMGAAVGFISGLFGIGGGFLMTPLLIFLGIPPAVAVATQSAQIVASSTTSVLSALRRNALDHKLGGILVAGGFVGSALGVWFFAAARRAGQLDLVIVISYVTLFTIVGSLMLKESIREFWHRRKGGTVRLRRKAGEHAPYLGWPLRMRFYRSKLYVSVIPILGLSLFIGFAGALLGIGGGFIVVPALLYVFRVPTNVVLAILLIVGGVFGAQFGARMGRHLRAELFRFLLALLLLAVGLRFGLELVLKPEEPFSITTQEVRT
jgi:uncharacterized protein